MVAVSGGSTVAISGVMGMTSETSAFIYQGSITVFGGLQLSTANVLKLGQGLVTLSDKGTNASIGGQLFVGYMTGPAKLVVNNGVTLTTT